MVSTSKGRALTQVEMVLISFYRVSGGTTAKVPYEELVLQAWRDFPEVFSLRNYPDFPDASDIHKKLYQGLKTDGSVVSLGNKMFRLTEAGLARAVKLLADVEGTGTNAGEEKTRLSREEERFFKHAIGSRTFAAWRDGAQGDLVDYDARVLFQFSTSTPVEERNRRVKLARQAAEKAQKLNLTDADQLAQLIDFLTSKFSQLFKEG